MDLKDIIGYCATQANLVYTSVNSAVSRYALGLGNEINRPEIRNLINTGHPVGAVVAIAGGFIVYNRDKIKGIFRAEPTKKDNLEDRTKNLS
jgi:hypothetical protein